MPRLPAAVRLKMQGRALIKCRGAFDQHSTLFGSLSDVTEERFWIVDVLEHIKTQQQIGILNVCLCDLRRDVEPRAFRLPAQTIIRFNTTNHRDSRTSQCAQFMTSTTANVDDQPR